MTEISDDKRSELQRRIQALDESIEEIEKLRAPYDKAIQALATIREEIIDADAGKEIADTCEGCSKLLFVGELGHRCEDGPTLCEACAPTWSDMKQQYTDDALKPEDRHETYDEDLAAIDAHIAAGDGDKKHAWPL